MGSVTRCLAPPRWEAGAIFAGEVAKGSSAKPLAGLSVYTSEDEYVFTWDDEG
jgi:hypothetical protein